MGTGDFVLNESPADFNLEFLHTDDSWYSIRLILLGDTLTVKYHRFPDNNDDLFHAGDFTTFQELEQFRNCFRPASVQAQDHECSKLVPGTTVCASYFYGPEEVRFHDAFVEHVDAKKHVLEDGEEVCVCVFMLSWLHGPKAGTLATAKIENICKIQSNVEIDPTLASFLNFAEGKLHLGTGSPSGGFFPTAKGGSCHEHTFHSKEANSVARFSNATALLSKENISSWMEKEQDTDMGGAAHSPQHFILVNNLEKDLSIGAVVAFIYGQTSIKTDAYIFPGLYSEFYFWGIIVISSWENSEKLFKFLRNSNHFIISSSGRPWIIGDKISSHGLRTQSSQGEVEGTGVGNDRELRLACMGTPEFRKAKQLSDLFLAFMDHLQGLHKRLALEERKISETCCVT